MSASPPPQSPGHKGTTRFPHLLRLVLLCSFVSLAFCDVYEIDSDKFVELYTQDDQEGYNETVYWHQANIDKEVNSIMQTGVWLYYNEPNYVGENVTAVFGKEIAINIQHPIRSLRYAGNTRFNALPSVVLYSDTWYRGTEYVVEVGEEDDLVLIPNFRDMGTSAKSLIIVGADWTFFPEQAFGGSTCLCLRTTHYAVTEDDDGYDVMMMASFYPDVSKLPIESLGSVMMSCKTPMRHLCGKLEEERIKRSKCPVLSNTVADMCR